MKRGRKPDKYLPLKKKCTKRRDAQKGKARGETRKLIRTLKNKKESAKKREREGGESEEWLWERKICDEGRG